MDGDVAVTMEDGRAYEPADDSVSLDDTVIDDEDDLSSYFGTPPGASQSGDPDPYWSNNEADLAAASQIDSVDFGAASQIDSVDFGADASMDASASAFAPAFAPPFAPSAAPPFAPSAAQRAPQQPPQQTAQRAPQQASRQAAQQPPPQPPQHVAQQAPQQPPQSAPQLPRQAPMPTPDVGPRTPGGCVVDRVYGMFFGAAIGGAASLVCERRDADVLAGAYPTGVVPYPRQAPAAGYAANDWPADVDQMFLAAKALAESAQPAVYPPTLAAHLVAWASRGLTEIGDREAYGVDLATTKAAGHALFLSEPLRAAKEVLGVKTGASAAIRALPAALLASPEAAAQAATLTTLVTQADARAVASAVYVSLLARGILRAEGPAPEAAGRAAARASALMTDAAHVGVFWRQLKAAGSPPEGSGGWDIGATAVAATYAYRRLLRTPTAKRGPELFVKIVSEIALRGNGASSNGAVAGAIAGAALGLSKLPQAWVAGLPHADWVEAQAAAAMRMA